METNGNKKSPKIPKKFQCEKCDYITCNKKDFSKHIETKKHFVNINQHISTDLSQKIPNYFCDFCNKTYKEQRGLII
jgi:hypothetical protein